MHILLVLMLSACEQPEPAQESSAEQPAAATGSSGGVGSVDANGNIAPFGFASREPVEMAEQPAEQAPASAATSELFAVHCAACHGAGLKAPVAPAYPKIAGQYQDYLYFSLKSYTVNNANVGRNNAIMQSQVKPYSDKDLRDMAAYIASLPGDLVVKK